MNDPTRLSQSPPARLSMNYAALRESGMELIRQYAGESWTDHNVHDPGITLLEAFCYAMTELGFRIQQDMPDLLRSGEPYARPDLPPAHRVLPSAPVTFEDLRQVLLDHPDISEAWIAMNEAREVNFYRPSTSNTASEAPLPSDNQGNVPPPFVYQIAPGMTAERVTVQGLYDVMVGFRESLWNSNVYSIDVTLENEDASAPPRLYTVEVALPYWDDPEAVPFRSGLVDLTSAAPSMSDEGWRPLDEPQSFFGTLEYTPETENPEGAENPDSSDQFPRLWVVLRIATSSNLSAAETDMILNQVEVALQAVETSEGNSPPVLVQFNQRVQEAYGGALRIQRYVESWRNLGEVPVRLQVARQQEIGIRARIEVTSSTDLELLLANIFVAIDLALSPPITFSSLEEVMQQKVTPETLFEGPLLRHGFLTVTGAETLARSGTIYTSDILRLIMQLRSGTGGDVIAQENPTGRDIVAVTDLALSNFVNNRPITTDASNCLTLVDIQRYRPRLSLAKSRITFVRNDLDIPYDSGRVEDLIGQLQDQQPPPQLQTFSPVWPVPPGESLPIDDYFPVQNDLPRLYGVGETGVPDSAGKQGKARALQTKGYLLLFEQFLADLTTQLGHINNFFSADPAEQTTYFTRALFDISGTERLLKGFSGDWEDPSNPYRQTLQTAAESRSQFLDRRNRMLDHLLARQGETMVTWAQELHRWAQKDLMTALRETAQMSGALLKAMETRRQAVNTRLIYDKAAFLAALPDLNATKLQAFGHPLRRFPDLLRIEQRADGFHWFLMLDDTVRLRSIEGVETRAAAIFAAEEAALLAAQPAFYSMESAGAGRRRYQLNNAISTDNDNANGLGESQQTWTTPNAVAIARNQTVALFIALRMEASMTFMERRIAYLTGLRHQARRLITSTPLYAVDPSADPGSPEASQDAGGYFEIYDEVDGDNALEKRWRLWERPDRSGEVLLSSVFHFVDDDTDSAIDLARRSIEDVIRYGLNDWNYHIFPAGETTFNFELRYPDGRLLGMANPPLASASEAQADVRKTIDHLYSLYSAEGFHMVEHILLRPQLSEGGRVLFGEYQLAPFSVETIADLPDAGQSLVIVARIDDSFHIRIFDNTGEMVVDQGNREFPLDAMLIQQLAEAFNQQSLDIFTQDRLLRRVISSTGYILADCFLQLPSVHPNTKWEGDPYSHQLSLIFPSGYARHFSSDPNEPDEQFEVPPHRFRDPEFRRHLERTVHQVCPAHLFPRIYWIDRQAAHPSQPFSAPPPATSDISFDQFESIYFIWLRTQLIPGVEQAEIANARNQMILALNALPHEPPTR
jgi:hypothetical protein